MEFYITRLEIHWWSNNNSIWTVIFPETNLTANWNIWFFFSRCFRLFFTSMFFLVLLLTAYFISNVWNKWNTMPIIIIQSAISMPVKDLTFPGIRINFYARIWKSRHSLLIFLLVAVTICNLNQVRNSAIVDMPRHSVEYSIVQSICQNSVDENITNSATGNWSIYRQVLLNVCSWEWVNILIYT